MITVYTRRTCGPCLATKSAMLSMGIPFREVDLDADTEAAQKVFSWGYRSLPVVEVGPDRHWCDFRPDLIRDLAAEAESMGITEEVADG